MAEITAKFPDTLAGFKGEVLWETLTCGDTGAWVDIQNFNDNTVTTTGTFNSETLTMQGSNSADGSNPFTLTDNNGLPAAFTSAGGRLLAEAPKVIRPSLSGSSGGDVDVITVTRKA